MLLQDVIGKLNDGSGKIKAQFFLKCPRTELAV